MIQELNGLGGKNESVAVELLQNKLFRGGVSLMKNGRQNGFKKHPKTIEKTLKDWIC